MTKLERESRVRREVRTIRFGDVVVELRQEGLYLRKKGTRTAYGPQSWDGLMVRGADLHAQQTRSRQKRAAKPARKQPAFKVDIWGAL
jgi:hypothetical protein